MTVKSLARRHVFFCKGLWEFMTSVRCRIVFQYGFCRGICCYSEEYEEGEESSNSSESEYSDGSDEEVFGRLVTLDWCKCSHCTAATLNHPRVCCKETAEASALTDANSEPITCIIHHDNFRAVCLNRAVLKTTLVRIKHLVQGMDFSASELPRTLY